MRNGNETRIGGLRLMSYLTPGKSEVGYLSLRNLSAHKSSTDA